MRRHEWVLQGGAGGWEVWACSRCAVEAIPLVLGLLWPDVGRFLARRWRCRP